MPRPRGPERHLRTAPCLDTSRSLSQAGLRTLRKCPSRFPRPPVPAPGRPASGQSAVLLNRWAAGVRGPVRDHSPVVRPNGRPWTPLMPIVMTPALLLTGVPCAPLVGGHCLVTPVGKTVGGCSGGLTHTGRGRPDPRERGREGLEVMIRYGLSGHRDVLGSMLLEPIRRIRRRHLHLQRAVPGRAHDPLQAAGAAFALPLRVGNSRSAAARVLGGSHDVDGVRRSVRAGRDGPRRPGQVGRRTWRAWWT